MTERVLVNPGVVAWAGDNPGIYLKETAEGDWTGLAVYFRVVYSPFGRGRAMVVLAEPDRGEAYPAAGNVCITDNPAMMGYLVEEFLAKFPTFRGRAGLAAMAMLPLEGAETLGSFDDAYSEGVRSGDLSLRMAWRQIGAPFAVEVSPAESAAGAHDMYSLFMEARDATVAINGTPLSGHVFTRPFFGSTMSTAFLAFSETWVTPGVMPGVTPGVTPAGAA